VSHNMIVSEENWELKQRICEIL